MHPRAVVVIALAMAATAAKHSQVAHTIREKKKKRNKAKTDIYQRMAAAIVGVV